MSGRRSKQKGASFERLVATLLKPCYPEARRMGQVQSGTLEYCDVENTPFWIECKFEKKFPSIRAAMRQAAETTDGRPIVAITKMNNEDILVTMRLEDWLQWVKTPSNT